MFATRLSSIGRNATRSISTRATRSSPAIHCNSKTPAVVVHRLFNPTQCTARRFIHSTTPSPATGMFDKAKTFLSGLTLRAEASHILIKGTDVLSEKKALSMMKEINNNADKFAEMAAAHSDCPSGSGGGSLGEFGRYSMVPEFDAVVFNLENEVGVVHGPVKTSFGYHLILIQQRND